MLLPVGRFTVSLMLPVPLVVKPVAPPVAVAEKVTPVKVTGNKSATVAPVALLGPVLVTTIVYVSAVPGTTEVLLSVLVICRSTCGVSVSVSVAVLLLGLVSVVPLGVGDCLIQMAIEHGPIG